MSNERRPVQQSLLAAADFAARKHSPQRRKDAEASPYINHPIAVAALLADYGVTDLPTLQAALLHDTIEDTQTSPEEVTAAFGPEVCALVLEVTDDRSLSQADRKRAQVEHAPRLSPKARLIKLADKIANLRDISVEAPASWSVERKLEYLKWGEEVVAGLRGVHPDLEQLFDRTVAEKRRLLGA